MGLITLVRGFKVSIDDFDDFLDANGVPPLGGACQPTPYREKPITKLFRDLGIDCEVRIFVPHAEGYSPPSYLFVCCDWIHVLAVKDMQGVFQAPVPPAFEKVRHMLGAKSEVRTYLVYNDESSSYTPQEVIKRNTAPIECGMCDAVFSDWFDRIKHRREVHGLSEDPNPLPEC